MQKITPKKITMEIGGKAVCFGERSYIMGILNVTPDSFSDGGDYTDINKAVDHAKEMIMQGADMIDIGGESSRPGYQEISAQEEMRRVLPVIERLRKETDTIISLDTAKASVAQAGIECGAHIINDIWGLQRDPDMMKVAAKYDVPVIVMHNQQTTEYEGDMIEEIKKYFLHSIQIAQEAGLKKERLILDPGIGFGKDVEQNMAVMRSLSEFRDMGYPVLLGTSRKRMIAAVLQVPPKERTLGNTATTVIGIMQGVDIFRVHDVKENVQTAQMTDAIMRG